MLSRSVASHSTVKNLFSLMGATTVPDGYYEVPYAIDRVLACQSCGALVVLVAEHDKFHKNLAKTAKHALPGWLRAPEIPID